MDSPDYELLICQLEDRYGDYGKIGLALLERHSSEWLLKLLLMSCRVMSRGIGTIVIRCIMAKAEERGNRLFAEFIGNDRNRIMYVTLKFAGFREISRSGAAALMEADLSRLQHLPSYIGLDLDW